MFCGFLWWFRIGKKGKVQSSIYIFNRWIVFFFLFPPLKFMFGFWSKNMNGYTVMWPFTVETNSDAVNKNAYFSSLQFAKIRNLNSGYFNSNVVNLNEKVERGSQIMQHPAPEFETVFTPNNENWMLYSFENLQPTANRWKIIAIISFWLCFVKTSSCERINHMHNLPWHSWPIIERLVFVLLLWSQLQFAIMISRKRQQREMQKSFLFTKKRRKKN